jgi:biopolymer transport protein ExbD
MHHVSHFSLLLLSAAVMTSATRAADLSDAAKAPAKIATAEYKRNDASFYPKGAIVKTRPTAVILPAGKVTQKDDSYFFTPQKKAPKEIFVEVRNDWVEPITPPDMPASLGVPPDAMQIREPQGDVQVAFPSAPANFAPVTDGMTLPNGAVVKTGDNGTAAVLFGGVDSARLMPDSAAAMQQTVTAHARTAEVDLTAGGIFSKVGTQVGVSGTYEVHTPFGNAVAHGGDFATVTTSARTDVWVAQGTIALELPNSKETETATADGTGPLKIIRFPQIPDPHESADADVESLTAVLNFIPLANQKLKALHDKTNGGATLTDNEQDYLKRIKEVPCLIKLDLVEPPAPAPVPAPIIAPLATAPTLAPPPAPPKPLTVVIHTDGKVKFKGATIGLAEFQSKLETLIQTSPDQAVVIKAGKTVPYDKFKAVMDACTTAQVKNVTVAAPAPRPPVETAVVPTPIAPIAPMTESPSINPLPPATAPAPAKPKPLTVVVHSDGKVRFKGATLGLAEFQAKLETLITASPNQALVIKAGKTVPYDKFTAVMDVCTTAQVKNVTVAKPAPTPPSETPATTPTPVAPIAPVVESPTVNPTPPSAAPAPAARLAIDFRCCLSAEQFAREHTSSAANSARSNHACSRSGGGHFRTCPAFNASAAQAHAGRRAYRWKGQFPGRHLRTSLL